MSRYVANCEWDGFNWVARVEGLSGAVTQAKRLDQLPGRIVEVVKLMGGGSIAVDDVTLHPTIGDRDLDRDAIEIAELEDELQRIDATLATHRRRVARELRARGFPLRDIGVIAHLSHQRVHQLLTDDRK